MQKKLSKIFVLVDLLVQEIDEPVMTPTKQTKEIQDKARELQYLLEPVLSNFYDNKQVIQSNFFQIMQNKFNYIFDKEYK
tara:strand:+ start:376 stop:615 length:240 start_codon:yes stop_codon:yes gene_type:complete